MAAIAFASGEQARAWLEVGQPPDARRLEDAGGAWVAPDVGLVTRGAALL